jgi:DNA-binding transcriptional LysR family regulator
VSLDVHPQLLRTLLAVLEAGSLTEASSRLGFTQSALSKQVAALESASGAQLFVRGPRGATPTPAATRLARRAAAVLDQLAAAERELSEPSDPVLGRVALGGFPTAAMHLVPATLAHLSRSHPDVEVEFLELSTPVQVRRLRSGRLDLALLAKGPDLEWDATGIHTMPLPSGPLLLAVGQHHPFAFRERVPVAELAGERWVAARSTRTDPQFGVWPTLADATVVAVLGDWSARLAFVAAGLGVTSIPSLAAPALPAGVRVVEVDDPARRRRALVVAHRGGLTPQSTAVRDALVAVAADLARGPHPTAPARGG